MYGAATWTVLLPALPAKMSEEARVCSVRFLAPIRRIKNYVNIFTFNVRWREFGPSRSYITLWMWYTKSSKFTKSVTGKTEKEDCLRSTSINFSKKRWRQADGPANGTLSKNEEIMSRKWKEDMHLEAIKENNSEEKAVAKLMSNLFWWKFAKRDNITQS